VVPLAILALGYRALGPPVTLPAKAHAAAEGFMRGYVEPSGRSVRHDQGGDTVSEGQAYAMLLAVALDDRARFESVWGWTRAHLLESNGLLASHWGNGRILDPQPATDADLLAARALALASKRFSIASLKHEAANIAHAILAHETALVGGRPVLTAGPWATGSPLTVNPSYFSPRAYADLASVAADPRWSRLEATSRTIIAQQTRGGRLVSDWASLDPHAGLYPSPSVHPGDTTPPGSGLDAARVPIVMAESCVPADRRLAAAMWPLLRGAPGRAGYALDGSPTTSQQHATSLVGAAAAASASGDGRASARLLDRARALDAAHPSYYGSVWIALGRVMLTSNALGGCKS
jgi:endoglucanase